MDDICGVDGIFDFQYKNMAFNQRDVINTCYQQKI